MARRKINNNTALAAVKSPNGDRRLFFQEDTGSIRQAYYTAASKTWEAQSIRLGKRFVKYYFY